MGLIFIDIWHINIPEFPTGYKIVLGIVHAATGFRKTMRIPRKSDAHLAIGHCISFLNSTGNEVNWCHADGAIELQGTGITGYSRSRNIRVTVNVPGQSRHNLREPYWRVDSKRMRLWNLCG